VHQPAVQLRSQGLRLDVEAKLTVAVLVAASVTLISIFWLTLTYEYLIHGIRHVSHERSIIVKICDR
jgi:hypothetical protein